MWAVSLIWIEHEPSKLAASRWRRWQPAHVICRAWAKIMGRIPTRWKPYRMISLLGITVGWSENTASSSS